MQLSDSLVTILKHWGVRSVFGVSGANIEHFHDSLHRLGGDQLQSIMARTETGAAFMADATARIHRTLGVCCSTSGGGMMNLAVGIAESFNDSVPVLAIVGQPPQNLDGRGAFQDSSGLGRSVDALKLWESITKYTARLRCAADFWPELGRAVRTALSGRPGPVALLIPRDLNELSVGPPPQDILDLLLNQRALEPELQEIQELHEMLRTARKPVIVLGSGMRRSSNPQLAIDYALQTNIPVMTTLADPGAFPNESPLYKGMIGVAGHPSAHHYINQETDLILAVGTGFNIMARAPIAKGLERSKVAVVNVDVENILPKLQPELSIEADATMVFNALLAKWKKNPFQSRNTIVQPLTKFLPKLDPPSQALAEKWSATNVLRQSQALSILQSYLVKDGHLLFDAGNCAASALHYLSAPTGTSTTIALGMGGMGYSIPAAIGAQLSSNSKAQTIAICGDGAFLMLGLEIHTAIDKKLPILFVVFNNNKHGMCTTRQQLFFEGRLESSDYSDIQIAQIARGLGDSNQVWAARAATPSQMRTALDEYLNLTDKKPGVLELSLPLEELPPFTTFLPENAETYSVKDQDIAA